ncbi:Metallophosphoesterase [Cordyceps fumosorosea ARSEF 2679]|uniref:Metallophosphoesterase n=1 Tax=Cordyceps fumosorosea (strain ARSEF 2679) TaxID=1081104 RepID=A0A168D4Q0_CORFA|nr:Metallophosphoesterase [Cordyceps fumosorosea ARSEF 2679]OAA72166.1 Metallophosphoesterase [Cordyceps fumosorosea ARSEF 2679]
MARIKTRILILSDTHGHSPETTAARDALTAESDFVVATTGYRAPLPAADVALHCGDLTTHSTPSELRRTLDMLRRLRAPLKVVIPGNHDRLLDAAFWSHDTGAGYKDPEYRTEALEMIEEAKEDGVVYLGGESAHELLLPNGALLRLLASPWTPAFGVWGFQYEPADGHAFFSGPLPRGGVVDVVMTHGPPRGVLDLAGFSLPQYGYAPEHAGCPELRAAVARVRPRVHCFGHIHEAWGAHLVRWKKKKSTTKPDDINGRQGQETEEEGGFAAERSIVKLSEVKPMTWLDPPATEAQIAQLLDWSAQMGVRVDWEEEVKPLDVDGERDGEHTLFVNAAIQGYRQEPSQLPFIVDMELDEAPSNT